MTKQGRVLLVDSRHASESGSTLAEMLREAQPDWKVGRESLDTSETQSQLARRLQSDPPQVILAALEESPCQGLQSVLELMRSLKRSIPVLAAVAAQPMEEAVAPQPAEEMLGLLDCGASDVILGPFRAADVLARVGRFLEDEEDAEEVIRNVKKRLGMRRLVGRSEAFLEVIRRIPRAAECDANVLVWGETLGQPQTALNLLQAISVDAVAGPGIQSGALDQEALSHQRFQGPSHADGLLADLLFQHPPLDDAFQTVLAVRISGQEGQDLPGRPVLVVGVRFHPVADCTGSANGEKAENRGIRPGAA